LIHLDTSVLVDVLRESGRGAPAAASRFLESVADEEPSVSVHALCELASGADRAPRPAAERERVRRLIAGLHVAYPDERFADAYGRLLSWLEARGQRIGTMDLLIATAAILDDAPLVTRNKKDFARVPGLRLLEY
jgi:tRNA(fMet)-specific endonuclease VapC